MPPRPRALTLGRRSFLKLGLSALGAGVTCVWPAAAPARLECIDYPLWGTRQCTVSIDSTPIYIAGLFDPKLSSQQLASQWCWAACIEMVFSYFGYKVPQKRIVQETWGTVVDFPGGPEQILENLNREWADEDARCFRARGDAYSTNVMTAAQDLAADLPLIIGTQGHAMLLTSMTYTGDAWGNIRLDGATVLDPWPGRGQRNVSPDEWNMNFFAARIRVEGTTCPEQREE